MSIVKIDWIETKGPDWKVATLTNEMNKTEKEVSINRTSKKGEVFPNFDALQVGQTIEGELWQSGAGKWYLFPPQPKSQYRAPTSNGGASRGSQMAKVMETKNQNIKEAQETKHEAIKLAGAQRDATLIVTTFYANLVLTDVEIASKVEQWMKYFLNLGEQPFI